LSSVLSAFAALTDPRVARTRRYPLSDLLLITLCGLLCGADNYVAICRWAKARAPWLREQLQIMQIPSHDTLGRVLAKLDSGELASALGAWSGQVWEQVKQEGDVVAFDGKRLKGALGNLNLISAWASRTQLSLALADAGQGAEEQAALRRLLGVVNVSGCLVTADALHTQTATAAAIVEQEADYLLPLKANQGSLYACVRAYFERVRAGHERAASACRHAMKERGVREERRCWTLRDVGFVDPWDRWPELRTLVCLERRCFRGPELLSEQVRYFVSSASGLASRFLRATRRHWGIKNSLHWRLDVFFREDDCRVRQGEAATNLATLRRLALSLLKREKSEKVGVQTKRQMAGWDCAYLEKLLAAG
jgi:predicted transposase YbfD/YdcC